MLLLIVHNCTILTAGVELYQIDHISLGNLPFIEGARLVLNPCSGRVGESVVHQRTAR